MKATSWNIKAEQTHTHKKIAYKFREKENEKENAWIYFNLQRMFCLCFIVYKIKFSSRQMEPSVRPQ